VIVENIGFTEQEIAAALRFSTQYPPSARDARFSIRRSDADVTERAHAHALQLYERHETEAACRVLRDHVRQLIDPEALNDLAVLMNGCGESAEALDLLRLLVRLHPEHKAGAQNLAALAEPG
jgi:hypothetical protein